MEQFRFQNKKHILDFIRPSTNSTFHCHNPNVLLLITRLRLELNHLPFHKFQNCFQDTLNPIRNCGTVETIIQYPLYCSSLLNKRLTLVNKHQSIDENILSKDGSTGTYWVHCFNWIHNFRKTFWWYLIKIDTYLFVYMQFSFSFYQGIARSFMLFSFVFSILRLVTLDYFVKWFILLGFNVYLCMFHQPAKICSKSYNW